MNQRTKELRPTPEVAEEVYGRDSWDGYPCCCTCGKSGRHDLAHYVPKAQGGLGIPENLINCCRDCHERLDHSGDRQELLGRVREYLQGKYEDWDESELTYSSRNEIVPYQSTLPDTIDDLAKFALVGREKLTAVRAEIRAIDKLKLADDVRAQKLSEAQLIAEAVMDAEVKVGELLRDVPKATRANNPSGLKKDTQKDTAVLLGTPKHQARETVGISRKQAERFVKLAGNKDIVEQAKAEARENDDIVSRSFALEKINAAKRKQIIDDKIERKNTYVELSEDACKLICGDIRGGFLEVPDNSVDFIVTDPPYPKEYIPLYESLSLLASRVLKDGGSLLCMCGQSYLNEVMAELCKHLNYHWTLCYLTPGGQSPQLWAKKTNTFWKPIIWLTKGKYAGDLVGDVIKTPPNENDKRYHEWGQSIAGFNELLQKFTYPGQTIFDPFLGGGTTAICAIKSGRRFIGADISQGCLDTTRNRVNEVMNDAGS